MRRFRQWLAETEDRMTESPDGKWALYAEALADKGALLEKAVALGVMKNCRRCKIPKFMDDFYKDSHAKDGRMNICRDCQLSLSTAFGKTAHGRELGRNRKQNLNNSVLISRARDKEKERAYDLKRRKSLKYKVGLELRNAVKAGKIHKSEICEECGSNSILHGHHPNYLKPLEVNWLCKKCHAKKHWKG